MDVKRKRRHTVRAKKNRPAQFCSIPIQAPVSNYSSKDNFYEWVNEQWMENVKIPKFETDYGVSEEVERCIYRTSRDILLRVKKGTGDHAEKMLKNH